MLQRSHLSLDRSASEDEARRNGAQNSAERAPVVESQSFTVLSQLAEARRRPSRLNATLQTSWLCLKVRAPKPSLSAHNWEIPGA